MHLESLTLLLPLPEGDCSFNNRTVYYHSFTLFVLLYYA